MAVKGGSVVSTLDPFLGEGGAKGSEGEGERASNPPPQTYTHTQIKYSHLSLSGGVTIAASQESASLPMKYPTHLFRGKK